MVRLQRQQKARNADGEHRNQRHLRGLERIGDERDRREDGKQQRKQVLDQKQACRALNVIDHAPPFEHHVRHAGKIGVEQHDLRRLRGSLAAGCHRDRAVGVLHCQNVVDAVARHGNGMPRCLHGAHELLLLRGRDTTEDRVAFRRAGDLLVRDKARGVYKFFRVFNACLPGNFRDGAGIIARDDLDRDILVFKIGEGLLCVFADAPGQNRIAQRLRRILPARLCQQQHAHALVQIRLELGRHGSVGRLQHKLRRAEQIGARFKGDAGILLAGRERLDIKRDCRLLRMREPVRLRKRAQRLHGFVRVLRGEAVVGQKVRERFVCKLVSFCALYGVDLPHAHAGLGDGAGFVDTQHVDPRKRFDALHVMEQHLATRKAHGTQNQRNGREHVEPLGDHADDGGDGGDDAFLQRFPGIEIALRK